ncbi:MAG: glycosyltransferase family 39 protein [Myxococcaceae bacterium]|nr:glycosyltransferase family 39 protein [Myxococcaceae bacterium]
MSGNRVAWVLAGVAVGPVLLGLSNQLHDYDPSQYAEVARRILASNEWLDLRDSEAPFTNKPPVTMWAQALAMAVFGVTSFAARLPVLLFGLLAMAATRVAGRELWDERTGNLAAIGVGASVAFQHMVADPKVDMPLLAFSTASIAALLVSRRRPGAVWVAWVAAGLAMLSKGPLGVVLPMAAVGPELLRESWLPGTTLWQRFKAMKLLRGALIVAAITVPFYVVVYQRSGADAAMYLLVRQGFGRLTGSSGWSDDTTPLFFVHTGAWAFFPMTLWLLVALSRRAVAAVKARALPGSVERVALWWLVIPFVAISVSTYKLPQYVYWLVAPAALLAARELSLLSESAGRRWRTAAVVFGVAVVVAVWASSRWLFPASPLWLVVVAAVQVGGWWLVRDAAAPERVLGSWVVVGASLFVFFHGSFHRSLLEFQPFEAMARLIKSQEPGASAILAIGARPTHSLPYYAERDLEMVTPAQVRERLQAQGGGAVRSVVLAPEVPNELLEAEGLRVTDSQSFSAFQTSIPSRRFLLAATRAEAVWQWRVVRVTLAP